MAQQIGISGEIRKEPRRMRDGGNVDRAKESGQGDGPANILSESGVRGFRDTERMCQVNNDIMYTADNNRAMKIVNQSDKPMEPELRRLVCSMAAVLKRKYPNPDIRKVVQERIMLELKQAA